MALIKCPECGKEISDKSNACIHCGCPIQIQKTESKLLIKALKHPNEEKIIGYGRLIGDGICFVYIHDVMVLPEYQHKKIGTKIMNKLLEKIEYGEVY